MRVRLLLLMMLWLLGSRSRLQVLLLWMLASRCWLQLLLLLQRSHR